MVGLLGRASGVPPFGTPDDAAGGGWTRGLAGPILSLGFVTALRRGPPARRDRHGRRHGRGPGRRWAPRPRADRRAAPGRGRIGAAGLAVVLHLPWSLDLLGPGGSWAALAGPQQAPQASDLGACCCASRWAPSGAPRSGGASSSRRRSRCSSAAPSATPGRSGRGRSPWPASRSRGRPSAARGRSPCRRWRCCSSRPPSASRWRPRWAWPPSRSTSRATASGPGRSRPGWRPSRCSPGSSRSSARRSTAAGRCRRATSRARWASWTSRTMPPRSGCCGWAIPPPSRSGAGASTMGWPTAPPTTARPACRSLGRIRRRQHRAHR